MKKLVLALVALAAAVAVATPALADYNFYGSMRFKTGYTFLGDKLNNADNPTEFGLQSNTRFGANATTGDLGGRVELGFIDAAGGANVYTRLMYGTWKTDAGTLLIGQTYLPYFVAYSMVYKNDDGFNGYGETYEGRTPMIKFDFTSGAYLAAVQNKQQGKAFTTTQLPKLVAGFKNKAGALTYNAGVGYQQYDQYYAAGFTNPTAATLSNDKRTIKSYLGYLQMGFKQEAVNAQLNLHYGQNLKEYGFGRNFAYDSATNKNTESYGGILQIGVSMINVGLSYTVDDTEGVTTGNTANGTTAADLAGNATGKSNKDVVAFINANFKPAKGFTIVPEVAYYDKNVHGFDWDGADEVAATVKWQMDF